jgi:hypothetical protein
LALLQVFNWVWAPSNDQLSTPRATPSLIDGELVPLKLRRVDLGQFFNLLDPARPPLSHVRAGDVNRTLREM